MLTTALRDPGYHRSTMTTRILRILFSRRSALLALGAAVLTACASLAGPRDYEVPLARLQHHVERRFPLQQRALALFDIRLQEPLLATQPNDRVALTVRLAVSSLLLPQQYQGSLTLSGRLQVDAQRNAVVLAAPQVERFSIDGVDERTQRQIGAAASLLAERLARDTTIYSYQPQDLRYAGVQFVPTAIRTSAAGLSIHLEPLRDGRL